MADSPKSTEDDCNGEVPLNGFHLKSSNEAEGFLGIINLNSNSPSILINKSLSHQIESLFTGVFLVRLIEGVPAIDTKLLPLTTLISPNS